MMCLWESYEKKIWKKYFSLASLKSMMKGVGSRVESASISQRYGSGDPDPHQNVKDPQTSLNRGEGRDGSRNCRYQVPTSNQGNRHCCGSVTFWNGSGDPYLWLTDPDSDSDPYPTLVPYFCQWPSRWQLKNIFYYKFFSLLFFEATFT